MWVEATTPLRVRFAHGEIRLRPGHPVELSEEDGRKVLDKAGDRIRVVTAPTADIIIEPASTTARPIYFEDASGHLCGPVIPEYLGRVGIDDRARSWVIVTHNGLIRWIHSDRLQVGPGKDKVGHQVVKRS